MNRPIQHEPAPPHERGGHPRGRPRAALARHDIQDLDDPYRPDRHLADNTLCRACGAVYRDQRWVIDEALSRLLSAAAVPVEVTCPACRRIEERNPQGIVTLKGDYWPQRQEEILRMVRHEETAATCDNPLSRIMSIQESEGSLVIETTNQKLAQRIGRAIERAHGGHASYFWSSDDPLVRVEWERRHKG